MRTVGGVVTGTGESEHLACSAARSGTDWWEEVSSDAVSFIVTYTIFLVWYNFLI